MRFQGTHDTEAAQAEVTAYYNENDKHAAAWLRELIKEGAIAPGDVDERSITEVEAKDLGRHSIGIEIEEEYCEIAVERLRQAVLF